MLWLDFIHMFSDPDRDAEWPYAHKKMEAQAESDPYRAWVISVFCLETGDSDYAYSPEWTHEVTSRRWSEPAPIVIERAMLRIPEVARMNTCEIVGLIVTCRQAVGLEMWTDETSWRRIRPLALALQERHESFAQIGASYLRGLRMQQGVSLQGSGDQDRQILIDTLARIETLERTRWATTSYDARW